MPSELLKNLMERAHTGAIVLPDFQRDFVWKPSDVIKLLASLMNNYPIGGLLFMENTEEYAFRPLSGAPVSETTTAASTSIVLVLDGQQRLTSCYRAFYGLHDANRYDANRHAGRYYFKYQEYVATEEAARRTVEGSSVESFIEFRSTKEVRKALNTTAAEIDAGLFPLDIIFQSPRGTDYSKWLSDFAFNASEGKKEEFERLSKIQSEFIRKFIERITSYQVHFEEIKKGTNPDVICTVFETINTTGKRLTVFDLLVARCYPKDVKLREMLDAAQERTAIHRFDPEGEELCVTALPRIVSLFAKKQCRRADMLELSPNVIQQHWDRAVDSLERALTVLTQRFGCFGARFVPLIDIIVPIAVILSSEKFSESDGHYEKLSKWYWRSVFSSYFVSSTETKVARTVREWTEAGGWLDDDSKEPDAVKNFFYTTSILEGVSRIDSAVYRGVIALLLSRGINDFGKSRLSINSSSETVWGEIEDHHIYPKGFLAPYGIKGDAANQVANRTPILKTVNNAIKNDAPHVYLNDAHIVGSKPLDDKTLRRHAIPSEIVRKPFSPEVYSQFISERRRLLLEFISVVVAADPSPSED